MTPLLDSVHSSPHEKANPSPRVGSGALQRVSTRSFSRAALSGQPPDWRVWRERVARVLSDVSLPVFSPSHLSLSLILFFFSELRAGSQTIGAWIILQEVNMVTYLRATRNYNRTWPRHSL